MDKNLIKKLGITGTPKPGDLLLKMNEIKNKQMLDKESKDTTLFTQKEKDKAKPRSIGLSVKAII